MEGADRFARAPDGLRIHYRDLGPANADGLPLVCLPGLTRHGADEAAVARADGLGLGAGGRLLTTRDWDTPADWIDAVLAPLAIGGSLVIVRNADEPTVARRVQQERATAQLR